jgi:diacylglycerol kinase (ATP)
MHVKVIYNPTAGRGRARKHILEVEQQLKKRGVTADVAESRSASDLVALAAESSRGNFDRVVVCGGDGTINLAIREFDLERGVLAVIPLGSGDDFARVMSIPRNTKAACDLVADGGECSIDVALANGHRYLGVAGLGFDSEVAQYANENVKLLRGSLVYFWAILRVLPRFNPLQVRIRNGSAWRDETIMFAAVGNSRQYGGGIRITPDAKIDDGQLDAILIHKTSRFELLKTLPRAYTGSHVKSSFVESVRGTQFRFESEKPLAVYADGERVTVTPVEFGLASQQLRVVAPATR